MLPVVTIALSPWRSVTAPGPEIRILLKLCCAVAAVTEIAAAKTSKNLFIVFIIWNSNIDRYINVTEGHPRMLQKKLIFFDAEISNGKAEGIALFFIASIQLNFIS